MAKKVEGMKYITLGEHWRKLYLKGTPIITIADKFNENKQVVSRSIWLAKIPEEIKKVIKGNPEIFTCTTLLNGFAGKRTLCEKNGFRFLRSEVNRLIHAGRGTSPKFPKPKKQKKSSPLVTLIVKNEETSSTLQNREAMNAEFQIKQALGHHCKVLFAKDGSGEIRIFFKDNKALKGIIAMLQPSSGLF